MRLIIDIDNTICITKNSDYQNSQPLKKRIKHFNQRFYNGDYIIYYTSRGAVSGIDWTELTKKQLKDWNVLYHELITNKPSYDIWIDDKCKNVNDYFNDFQK